MHTHAPGEELPEFAKSLLQHRKVAKRSAVKSSLVRFSTKAEAEAAASSRKVNPDPGPGPGPGPDPDPDPNPGRAEMRVENDRDHEHPHRDGKRYEAPVDFLMR